MCLILFSWRQRPDYPLILAANRDEFHARPTAPAAFWPQAPQLLAGRDLVAGGTWLGVTRDGRWGAVTNYRDPAEHRPGALSRGTLVRDFLLSGASPRSWLQALADEADRYPGFNLLLGASEELFYFSNREGILRPLPPGLYALSNGLLDTAWPKATGGKSALAAIVAAAGQPEPRALFALLADTSRPADEQLPDTGVGLDWERRLAARFIVSPGYGTRSSTLLLVSATGEVLFHERSFTPQASDGGQVRHRFLRG